LQNKTGYLILILTFLSKLAAPWLMISVSTAVLYKKFSCLELHPGIPDTRRTPSNATTYLWQQPYISSLTCGSEWASSFRITPLTIFHLLSSRDILKIKQHQSTNHTEITDVIPLTSDAFTHSS